MMRDVLDHVFQDVVARKHGVDLAVAVLLLQFNKGSVSKLAHKHEVLL
jgi:hypothetical protein